MLLTVEGIFTDVRFLQSINEAAPILVTPSGISSLSVLVLRKAYESIILSPFSSVTLVKD